MSDEKQKHNHSVVPAEQPLRVPVPEDDGTHILPHSEPHEKHDASADQCSIHTVSDQHVKARRHLSDLHHVRSHISTHDAPGIIRDQHYEQGDEVYDKFSPKRKIVIVMVLSVCSFLAPISSTSILAASPEVVSTFHTTGDIFDVSNALYLVFMGLSPLFYGPLASSFGRKSTLTIAAITFTAFSLGSALSPNLASYFIFRMLTAFQGTSFLTVGGTVVGDIYRPVERGTAYAYFLTGTLLGPALGPFIGGIIVTFVSWRDIFWLQTALGGLASILVLFLVPETIHYKRSDELSGLTRKQKAKKLWEWTNPWRVVVLFRYPNILVAGLASGALVWNQYSLLTPIRYVLNPRFGLTTPLQSGLFYIAPGFGYVTGTFFGGRWADRVVRKWIKKRNGQRIPEDRLNSTLTAMGVLIPGCMLVYGWCIDKKVGGIPVPVIAMFLQGVGQTICFPSLNTYCLDVMKGRSSEVVAGNYVIRYVFAAAGSAACLPLINRIGVGWFSTISALFLVLAAVATYFNAKFGAQWRQWIDGRCGGEEK